MCKVVVVALFLGFCVGGVLYGFGGVGAVDVVVDGEVVVIGGVGSQGGLMAAGGRSPVWPFRGIVRYAVSDTDGHMVLQYWNTETGAISEVQLGPLPGCGISPVASDKLVELGSWSPNYYNVMSDGPVRYVVPWGDEAYPVLNAPGYGDDIPVTAGRPVVNQTVFDGRLEVSHVGDLLDGAFVLRVATPQQEAYYNPGYDPSSDTGSGYWPTLDEVPLRGVDTEDSYDEGPWVAAVGTDGFYYGIGVFYNDPACPAEDLYIFAGDTGEVVACSHSASGPALGGAAFVLPEGAQLLDRFALPQPFTTQKCPGLDLWKLGIPPIPSSGPPTPGSGRD